MKKILLIHSILTVLFWGTMSNLSAQNIDDFLQGDFAFTAGSLADASPNMIDGTGFDLSTTVGIELSNNSAFSFNGSSSYIDCGTDNRSITDEVTISAWFKTTVSNRQIIISKYNVNDDRGYVLGITVDGEAALDGRDGASVFHRLTTNGINVADGQWHHLVGVINKNHWQLYLDCELINELTTNTISPQFSGPRPLTIGRLSTTTNDGKFYHFEGTIDNVKLYNAALTVDQIGEISNFTCPSHGENPLQSIVKRFFSEDDLQAYSLIELPNEELLLLGKAQQSDALRSILLMRCTKAGNIIWSKSLEATGLETPFNIIQTSDGGFAIIGITTSGSLGDSDILLVKLDNNGDLAWSKVYGNTAEDRGFGIYEFDGDHLLIAGSTRSYGAGERDALLMKVDADGDVVWTRTYGGSASNEIFLNGLLLSDTEFLFNGVTVSFGGGLHDIWLLRVDAAGNFLSGSTYGDSGHENPMIIKATSDGGYLVAGHGTSSGIGQYDGLLVKLNATGEVQWAKAFGGPEEDQLRSMEIGEDGHIYLLGITASYGAGLSDFFLVEVAEDGQLIRARTYGKGGEDSHNMIGVKSILALPNDRLIAIANLENEGVQEVMFANFYNQTDDVCLGEDWPLTYIDVTPTRRAVTPIVSSPEILSADLSFSSVDYPLGMDYFTSEYCPVDLEVTQNFTPCSYQASNDLWTSGVVAIEGDITFRAGNSLSLRPGFSVKAGNQFTALIGDCSQEASLTAATPEEFSLLEIAPEQRPLRPAGIRVFPNPASSTLTIQLNLEAPVRAQLELYSADGRKIRDLATNESFPAGEHFREVAVADLSPGFYLIRYQTEKDRQTIRFVVAGYGR